jgi:hypothetical protein
LAVEGEKEMKRILSLILLTVLAFATTFSMVKVTDATAIITVGIDPAVVPGKVGRNFTFDITIDGVNSTVLDLYAWELKLNWTDTDFNYVGTVEGSFLKSSGPTFWVSPIQTTSLGKEILTLSCSRTGTGSGSLGSGVLATVTLYVVGGTTGSLLDLGYVKLRNSILDPIEPPSYDVSVIVQDGTFARPRSYDLEPNYGEVDIYDLSAVGVNFGTNVIRVTKIATQWAIAGGGGWTNPEFVGAPDDNRAVESTLNDAHRWTQYGFNTTSWSGVSKVEVGLERMIDSGSRPLHIEMSNDNGATWSATTFDNTVAEQFDTMVWVDVSTAYGWTKADVNNIAVKLSLITGTGTIRVDYLAIRVTPSPVLAPPEVFEPEADVNNDLTVDIDDLIIVAINYGEYDL